MPDGDVIKLVIQGGSFALLAIMVVWLLWWGAPMMKEAVEAKDKACTDAFKEIVAKFDASLVRQEERHERQLAKRDIQTERIVESLDALATRIENIERRTDEFPIPRRKSGGEHTPN